MWALRENKLANEIVVVNDGAEALDYLYRRGKFQNRESGDPCVMLLDLKMPRVDGLEVLRTLKADERLRSLPVVVLTFSRAESDLLQSYRLGVNAFVVKPVDFSKFLECVKQTGAFWALVNEPPPAIRSASQ